MAKYDDMNTPNNHHGNSRSREVRAKGLGDVKRQMPTANVGAPAGDLVKHSKIKVAQRTDGHKVDRKDHPDLNKDFAQMRHVLVQKMKESVEELNKEFGIDLTESVNLDEGDVIDMSAHRRTKSPNPSLKKGEVQDFQQYREKYPNGARSSAQEFTKTIQALKQAGIPDPMMTGETGGKKFAAWQSLSGTVDLLFKGNNMITMFVDDKLEHANIPVDQFIRNPNMIQHFRQEYIAETDYQMEFDLEKIGWKKARTSDSGTAYWKSQQYPQMTITNQGSSWFLHISPQDKFGTRIVGIKQLMRMISAAGRQQTPTQPTRPQPVM